jgi:citrate lyase beta subunit
MDRTLFSGVRTLLFVAGHHPDQLDALGGGEADIVVLDLEDMVPQGDKESGRRLVAGVIQVMSPERRARTFLRPSLVSGRPDPRDIAVASGLAGLVLPKAESADQVALAADLARQVGAGDGVVATVETALGILRAFEIGQVGATLGLIFGPSDLSLDLGLPSAISETMTHARERTVLCAVAARVQPIDGAFLPADNPQGLSEETTAAKALGFTAKLVVHAHHVPVVNRLLTPSDDELARAIELVEARESTENPIRLARARRVLSRMEAITMLTRDRSRSSEASSQ